MLDTDIAIIGGGTMGLATATALSSRTTRRVRVFDAARPPHTEASHHGHSRLVRVAYGEGRAYVPLAQEALRGWERLNQAADAPVFIPTGILNIGAYDSPFLAEVETSARSFDLRTEPLNHADITQRWPGWSLNASFRGCFEPQGGVVLTEPLFRYWRSVIAHSANIAAIDNTPITSISKRHERFVLRSLAGDQWQAEQILVAAGRANRALLRPLGIELPIQRVRKVFGWFDHTPEYDAARWPGFSYCGPGGDYYGFPAIDGHGVKIGRHDGGQHIEDETTPGDFGSHPSDLTDLRRLIDRHMPGVGELQRGAVCEYLRTQDEHFIIDEPIDGLFIAAGFSGHGFKFAPAIGDRLGDWMCSHAPPASFQLFNLGRF